MDFYCTKEKLSKDAFRILIDGKRVDMTHTVGDLEMENGDTYDPFLLFQTHNIFPPFKLYCRSLLVTVCASHCSR